MTYVSGIEAPVDSVPLVLLAGTFVSSRYWQRLLPYLPKNRRIIAVDTIGVGLTSRARAPRDMALLAQSAMLAELFDTLHLKQADILGASYGGNIGLTFAGLHPDQVRSVTAIESPIFASSYEWLHQVRSGLEWLRAGWLPFLLMVNSGLLARRWTNTLLGRRLSTAPGFKKSSVFRCLYDPNARLISWRSLVHAPIDDPMHPLTGIRAPILFLQASESPLRGQLDHTHELLSRLTAPLTWQTLPLAQHDVAVQLPVVVAEAVGSFWASLV
jgi:pimeloyl-ACP methyl ester carboxylesterase